MVSAVVSVFQLPTHIWGPSHLAVHAHKCNTTHLTPFSVNFLWQHKREMNQTCNYLLLPFLSWDVTFQAVLYVRPHFRIMSPGHTLDTVGKFNTWKKKNQKPSYNNLAQLTLLCNQLLPLLSKYSSDYDRRALGTRETVSVLTTLL